VVARQGCDFYALYLAGDNLRHGRDVYDESGSAKLPCLFSYRYLPIGASLGIPFSYLTPSAAYLSWILLIEFCLFLCLWCTWLLAEKDFSAFAGLSAIWLCASPLYLELRMGQYSLVQATFVMIAATAVRRGFSRSFTAAMTASLCFKMNTWLAAPSLIKERRWSPIALAGAVIFATSMLHYLKFPDSLDTFLSNFRVPGIGPENGFTRGNLGLAQLIGVAAPDIFSPMTVRLVFLSVFAAGCAVTLFRTRMDLAAQLVFWLGLSVLAYKHTWEHHYAMLLPALVFAGLRSRGVFFLVAALLILLPTPYYIFLGEWLRWQEVLYHAWKPAGAALTLVCLAGNRKV
jgi:hypothetical protein